MIPPHPNWIPVQANLALMRSDNRVSMEERPGNNDRPYFIVFSHTGPPAEGDWKTIHYMTSFEEADRVANVISARHPRP